MNEFTVNQPAPDNEPAPAPSMWMPILVGAAVIVCLSLIPFASLTCCLPMIVGGLLATWMYSRHLDGPMPMSKGITIGLLTTLLGGIVTILIVDLIWITFDHQLGAETMKNVMLQLGALLGEEAAEQMAEAMEQSVDQALTPVTFAMQLASSATIAAIGGLISGSLGAALFKGGKR